MRSLILSIAVLVVLAGADRANAVSVTFAFTGTVEEVFDGLGVLDNSVVPRTTTFTGYYTFDSETPNTAPLISGGEGGLYHHDTPPAGVRINVGTFLFRSVLAAPDFDVIANDQFGFVGSDDYGFHSRSNEALGLHQGGPVDVLDIRWDLSTVHGNPLESAALPIVPPDLSLFDVDALDRNELTIRGECTKCGGPAAFFTISGPVTSLTLVPEPSTVVLATAMMLGLALHACRRNR